MRYSGFYLEQQDIYDENSYEPINARVHNSPVSNFKYAGNKFKADVNMNATNVLCAVSGLAIGAAIAYYFLTQKK